MNTMQKLSRLLSVSGLLLAAAGCDPAMSSSTQYSRTSESPARPAKYVHAVFFKCQPGTSDADIDAMVNDGVTLLSKVPSVRKLDTGRRDAAQSRDVNDQAFDVGLLVHFDDAKGLQEYIDHPLHQEFVARHKPKMATVRVFDYVAK